MVPSVMYSSDGKERRNHARLIVISSFTGIATVELQVSNVTPILDILNKRLAESGKMPRREIINLPSSLGTCTSCKNSGTCRNCSKEQ
jgi:hypothetical protein